MWKGKVGINEKLTAYLYYFLEASCCHRRWWERKNNRAQAARRYGGRDKGKLERMLLTGVVCFVFYKSRKPLSLYIHPITTTVMKQHHPFFSHTPTTLIPILLFLATLTPFSLYYKCRCARVKATSFSPWKLTPCFPLEENEMSPLKLIKHIIGRVYHRYFHWACGNKKLVYDLRNPFCIDRCVCDMPPKPSNTFPKNQHDMSWFG